jgi:fatty acid desaturase
VTDHGTRQPWRFEAQAPKVDLPPIDYDAFARDLDALRRELGAGLGAADLAHGKRMERWGRACSVLGYVTSCLAVNPVSIVLLSLGNVARWTMVTHHVMHRGYDKVPGVPRDFQSKHYARGLRRFVDWLDWMHPAAWAHEHNQLHHYHTGEFDDPDLVEHNAWLLRIRAVPRPLRALMAVFLMGTWKLLYYAPNTFWSLKQHELIQRSKHADGSAAAIPTMGNAWRIVCPGERLLLPVSGRALLFYARCVLPYGIVRFGLLPALFLPLGTGAWFAALLNLLLAEVLANVHSFFIIVPNHAGDDLYRFDGPIKSKAEFYVRQVTGSVNYPGGTDLKDFLQGYLNYQIEHHLWPDLPMLKYREAAPRVKALCAKHGVPYVEESVFRRFARLWAILLGDASMRRTDTTRPIPTANVGDPESQQAATA